MKILKEYSDKKINDVISRWKQEKSDLDSNLAKQIIQRFDQIKSSLSQKLNIIALSDDLRKGNNYLDIDKYSLEDMVKLLRSLPENPDKIKKEAINKFHTNEYIDKQTAQSYVVRFLNKKDELKYAVENGLEDGSMSAEEVSELIPNSLKRNNLYLDPRNWKWQPFEQMLDAIFPSQRKSNGDENLATTDADKIYDKNGIEIYKGDDVNKCISYNPQTQKGRKKYGWCVTQPGNTNYDYYRFAETSPTFYFIFDRNKPSTPEHAPFDDQWHAFVIQVNSDGKSYVITGANNRGDIKVKSWEEISKEVPSDTWSKIKNLKDYFKPISLSAVERGRKFASGRNLNLDEFKELSQDEKILYVQGKASKNSLSGEILNILPSYKISYEGRSTTLANIAIDSGQEFEYSFLKQYPQLAKRYAVFRFRHTNYSTYPIPLPYVQYLDEDAKEKYLKTFDDNLNFFYIEKFFGEENTRKYVENQLKNLDYLPVEAAKYIRDPKEKQLFLIYSKLFQSWEFGNNYTTEEKDIENVKRMPEQTVYPKPLNYKQWTSLKPEERKVLIELADKISGKSKYSTLLYALPYIIKYNGQTYILLPKDNFDYVYLDWILIDTNNKIIKDNINGDDSTLVGELLSAGYVDIEEHPTKVFEIKDLKLK